LAGIVGYPQPLLPFILQLFFYRAEILPASEKKFDFIAVSSFAIVGVCEATPTINIAMIKISIPLRVALLCRFQ